MMNNLQSSAFVAKTTQLLSSVARLRLLLVMFLTLTVSANAWGADVTLSSSTITSGKKLAYDSEWTYTANNVSWSGYCYTDANSRQWIQLKKDKGVYVKIVTPSGSKITQLKVTITSATNSSGGVNDITKHNDFSGRVALLTEDVAGSTSMTGVAYTTTVSNDIATLNPSGNNNTLYLKVSGGARIWSMTVTYETAAASCTSITPSLSYAPSSLSVGETANPTLTGNTGNGTVTYTSSSTSVATVNASTGVVTAKAAGTTTITANIAANNGYCEGTATANVTVTADPYTVTLEAGSGSVTDTELTETSAGAGVTLPTATIDCGDVAWTFAGWAEASVGTETEEAPSTLYEAGDTYKPTSNITLYAVYKRTEEGEGGGGGDVTESVDFSTKSYSDGQEVSSYEGTNFSVTFDKGTNSNAPKYYNSGTAIRVYAGGYFIVSSEATITKIVLTFGSSDKTNTITTNIDTYSNGTWTGSATSVQFTIGGTKDHRRIQAIEVTTSGGGNSSTTYYHSTPECSTETLVSVLPKIVNF